MIFLYSMSYMVSKCPQIFHETSYQKPTVDRVCFPLKRTRMYYMISSEARYLGHGGGDMGIPKSQLKR